MTTACIGFGSNVGDRQMNIVRALALLQADKEISIQEVSGLYETQPVGPVEQNDFLNGVVFIRTEKTPQALLAACLRIEEKLGRQRSVRWGPRSIDLDILLYNDLVLQSSELTIPHKELENRRFVLEPLAEVAAEVVAPNSNKTIRRLLQETQDDSRVRLVKTSKELLSMIKKV